LANLEKRLGTDRAPRHIVIWFGTYYKESWIERLPGRNGKEHIHFHVKVPDDDASPRDYLTAEQLAEIRPGDRVAFLDIPDNGRNAHMQGDRPPWKRRPWRFVDGGRGYELLDEDGVWRRVEP
jgi:hypothetical protein